MAVHRKTHDITSTDDHDISALVNDQVLARISNALSGLTFDQAATASTLAQRDSNGDITVPTTPGSASSAASKNYVDNVASGLQWIEPVDAKNYIGTRTVTQINALSPSAGDTVVAGDSGTPSAGTSDLLSAGDLVEFDGTSWLIIVTNSGGFPPADTRALVKQGTLFAPLTDGTDDGKIAEWDGTSLTPSLTTPSDGDAVLVNGDGSVNENIGYTFSGTVPSGDWTQFTGAGQISAGDGLTKTGNTLDVGAGNGISVAADSVAVQSDTTGGANLGTVVDVNANGVAVRIDDTSVGENVSNQLEVKDGGVSTAKIADSAVTTAKINNDAVTLAKLADQQGRDTYAGAVPTLSELQTQLGTTQADDGKWAFGEGSGDEFYLVAILDSDGAGTMKYYAVELGEVTT